MKLKYYCSCRDKTGIEFTEVKVNSDGVCCLCGYYAISNIDIPDYEGNLKTLTKEVIQYKLDQYGGNLEEVAKIYDTNKNYLEKILQKGV